MVRERVILPHVLRSTARLERRPVRKIIEDALRSAGLSALWSSAGASAEHPKLQHSDCFALAASDEEDEALVRAVPEIRTRAPEAR